MKHILTLFLFATLISSCKNNNTETPEISEDKKEISYLSFGEKIDADQAVELVSIAEDYKNMKVGDSVSTKLIGKVDQVCQAKGCWMKMDLGNDEQVMVKFKDYGFFMPKNIAGKDVIIDGEAFVSELSVEELRHYAEDAGKSEEEIAAITEPRRTYSFVANGALLIEE
ncbi:DUF4920 domain-containing protein [Xanthomarina sp. F1114]|uniref:DUF4920 domain-containing protein n=1 Tax=Xanthomarina sp. F1114 TaxID=2996019 RepID=UPI00225DE03F|nr:DUF4920 domain-containing protein [Xanthomarina sp. F1114]MCX7547090.1 DUF4920 domain-containing protein [Xanthomarina sp. F1114]